VSKIPTNKNGWNSEVKETCKRLLEIGRKEILMRIHIEHWLSNLSDIIKYGDERTRNTYIEVLSAPVNELYGTQRPSHALVITFQQVNRFNNSAIESLVGSSVNNWSSEEFSSLTQFIDFKRKWKTNRRFMNNFLDRISMGRNNAENNAEQEENSEKSYRLKKIDELIKNSENSYVRPTFLD
jgi:hypothetical protein